jgi:hypothetical protein
MPIEVVKLAQISKQRREKKARITRTAEWEEVVKKLDSKTLGADEALVFTLTPEEMKTWDITKENLRTVVRPLKRNLLKSNLYRVNTRNTPKGAQIIFRWVKPPNPVKEHI